MKSKTKGSVNPKAKASKMTQNKCIKSLAEQKELCIRNDLLAQKMVGTEMNPMKRAFISQWLLNK